MTNLEAEQRHFFDIICDEVDIRIGTYRIGTLEGGKVRVWFALKDGNPSPDGFPFDTRQQAIDHALNKTVIWECSTRSDMNYCDNVNCEYGEEPLERVSDYKVVVDDAGNSLVLCVGCVEDEEYNQQLNASNVPDSGYQEYDSEVGIS